MMFDLVRGSCAAGTLVLALHAGSVLGDGRNIPALQPSA